MNAQPAEAFVAPTGDWDRIGAIAPTMAATMRRYLEQVATFLAPRSVDVADLSLRQLAGWLLDTTDVRAVAAISRADVEDYKRWLAAQPGATGKPLAANTRRQRLHTLRMFFDRLSEWDWPDTPARNPVIAGDIPASPDPLPKFLDDKAAAKFMAAARNADDPRDRIVCELLARTGLRASELCDLAADAVVLIGDNHWLRVPLGKLRNDRYVPLHPNLVDALARWTANNIDMIRCHRRLIADRRGPLDRHAVGRIVGRVGRAAGIDVHPHQLRHTLATQAINRGMRLEAIAALLGHRSMHMTLTYARIADRTVADQYAALSDRRALRPARSAPRQLRNHRHGAPTPRSTRPHARQRPMRPTRPTRVPHGNRLRDLQLLPDHHRVPADPPTPTRPRPPTRPNRPRRALRQPRRTHRQGPHLTAITRIMTVRARLGTSSSSHLGVMKRSPVRARGIERVRDIGRVAAQRSKFLEDVGRRHRLGRLPVSVRRRHRHNEVVTDCSHLDRHATMMSQYGDSLRARIGRSGARSDGGTLGRCRGQRSRSCCSTWVVCCSISVASRR
jgi:site-specific recombinase XerD